MIADGLEVIVGLQRDPQFGPALLLGMGGVLVELVDDHSLRLPPIARDQAEAMIAELRGAKLLSGYRGGSRRDVGALAKLLVDMSNLAVEQGDQIESIDLNPVLVLPDGRGVTVVDYVVIGRGPES